MSTQPHLPAGYQARAETLDDANAVCAFINDEARELTGDPVVTVEEYRADLEQPSVNREFDTRVVVADDGSLAAVAEVQFMSPYVHTTLWVRVARPHQGRGLGTALTQWAEGRAAERVAEAPADAEVLVEAWNFSAIDSARPLLADLGFAETRRFLNMYINLEGQPALPQVAPGIRIVSLAEAPDIPLRAIHRAQREGFRDHFGFVERDMEESFREWEHDFTSALFDPELKLYALEGAEIVGLCHCTPPAPTATDAAWVDHITVLRRWRNRGLAQALLLHAFHVLRIRGATRVGLGVDADSLTGATRLYEKVGMQTAREMILYAKVLRPGVDLSRRSLPTM